MRNMIFLIGHEQTITYKRPFSLAGNVDNKNFKCAKLKISNF